MYAMTAIMGAVFYFIRTPIFLAVSPVRKSVSVCLRCDRLLKVKEKLVLFCNSNG